MNKDKFKKEMHKHLSLAEPELEKAGGKKYAELSEKIWDYYEKSLLERFPYVGGDKVSGTKNLTGAYYFVVTGEALKRYGVTMADIVQIMVRFYERGDLRHKLPERYRRTAADADCNV